MAGEVAGPSLTKAALMSLELERLLTQEVEVGTYHSTGTFSLALAEARRKLAQHQLTSLAEHVLKLLQGVIQLEPGAIWIESDSQGFALYWGDPDIDLEGRTFLSQLDTVVLGNACPSKDLGIGLLGFLDCDPDEVWWCQWERGEIRQLECLSGQSRQAQLRAPLTVYSITYALVVKSSKANLAVDRDTVAGQACFAPVQILWNGGLLNGLDWKLPGETSHLLDYYLTQNGPLARGLALKPLGACQYWGCPAEPSQWVDFAPRPEATSVMLRHLQLGKQRRLDLMGGRQHLRTSLGEAIWVLRGRPEAPSALWCVKHGILLKPLVLPMPLPGLLVVVATPDLEVDLGQFQALRNSQSYRDLKVRVLAQARALVPAVLSGPAEPGPRGRSGIFAYSAAAFLGGAVLGTWLMPGFCLVVGPMLGVAAAAMAQEFQSQADQRRQVALEKRLEELSLRVKE